MHTGHAANIFSVKFLPHSGDRILVTGAADTKVHVHDVTVKETIHMFSDHTNRVKRIATAPMWPNTFWSAAEDGVISKRSDVLIDLTEYCGQLVEAKCLAVNPCDNNYLAVGANGPFVRLYDIRMIHNYRLSHTHTHTHKTEQPFRVTRKALQCCVCVFHRKFLSQSAEVHTFCDKKKPIPDGAGQYYVAGHLPVKLADYNNRLRVLVATYVTFSPDGTELLVNMGGEQAIQLYSLGIHTAGQSNAMLYGNRAAAYMKRKWDGDHYDALRDCLKALSLNPAHLKAHFRLARCLFELKYVAEALECLDDFKGKFPEQADSSACSALDKDIKAALFSKSDSADEKKGSSSIRFHNFTRKESIPEDEIILRERSFDYKHRLLFLRIKRIMASNLSRQI
ncbi:WD and tetratricopeptide repeats protein 1 [Bagarius yarrelli]|uniref:WD and tetratricopeptide repeats protein 1 n=1 Tax=Bagarius yarrelli TaxID=175774 RepID=A0A556VUM8_BAGYA|nr:WD and tetratricopeptide repeats protein 1 [Bagarius yarrelli]